MFFGGISIGRLIANLRIVKNDGRRMNIMTIFIRAFMQSLVLIAPLNVAYQLYYKTSSSIYDYVTNTHNTFIWNK